MLLQQSELRIGLQMIIDLNGSYQETPDKLDLSYSLSSSLLGLG